MHLPSKFNWHRSAAVLSGLATLLVVAVFQALSTASAMPANIFEIDANSADAAGGGEDWNTLFADGTPPAGSSKAFTGIIGDAPNPSDLTTFTGGGSKDDIDIPSWRHVAGTSPDKAELLNAYAAAYLAPDGSDPGDALDLVLYFGSDRYSQNGSTNVGFWFTKQKIAPVAGGLFSGAHETGDTLVLSEFTNGGAVPGVQVWRWDPAGSGPICPSTVTSADIGCKDNDGTLKLALFGENNCATANACAVVNASQITVPWTYDAKGGGNQPGKIPTAGFIEGGINLSALSGGARPCLSNFVAETRSSPSTDAVLLDFVRGDFPLCSASISIGPDDTNGIFESHTFTVNVNRTFAGDAEPAPDGTVANVTLNSSNADATITTTSNTCASPGTVNGQCTISFYSDLPTVVTGSATASVNVDGITIAVATGTAGNSANAVKTFKAGSLTWTKTDDLGAPLAGATFQVCRTHTWASATSTMVDTVDDCVTVADDVSASDNPDVVPDADNDGAEFLLTNQVLGRYTIVETAAPPGYALDPDTITRDIVFDDPATTLLDESVGNAGVFVDPPLFKVIVLTCTTTGNLVDGTVNLNPADDADRKATITTAPGGLTEAQLCSLGGASYAPLARGNYTFGVEIPDEAPLFP